MKRKEDSVVEILVGCSIDIKSLWTDEAAEAVLKSRNMKNLLVCQLLSFSVCYHDNLHPFGYRFFRFSR
jgi:hypothetical protein